MSISFNSLLTSLVAFILKEFFKVGSCLQYNKNNWFQMLKAKRANKKIYFKRFGNNHQSWDAIEVYANVMIA